MHIKRGYVLIDWQKYWDQQLTGYPGFPPGTLVHSLLIHCSWWLYRLSLLWMRTTAHINPLNDSCMGGSRLQSFSSRTLSQRHGVPLCLSRYPWALPRPAAAGEPPEGSWDVFVLRCFSFFPSSCNQLHALDGLQFVVPIIPQAKSFCIY